MRDDSWSKAQAKRPHEVPDREPSCEPSDAIVKRFMQPGQTTGVISCQGRAADSITEPANGMCQNQLPNMPESVQLLASRQDPRWYDPRAMTSCALAAPAHSAAGLLKLPAGKRPSWPLGPQPQGPGSVIPPVTQRGSTVSAGRQDDSHDEEPRRQHTSSNRKRTSSTDHLIEELAKRIPSTQAHLTAVGPKRSKLDILEDVLAWVEASHGWFAAAGVEPPLPSVDESMPHRLTGALTSVVRRKQRRDPSPTEAETWLGQAPTVESVASDDTESCHSCDGRM